MTFDRTRELVNVGASSLPPLLLEERTMRRSCRFDAVTPNIAFVKKYPDLALCRYL